jgi:hypothetical protein
VDTERYARKQIDEAIDSGELTPTVGVGEPIDDLTNDPEWWVRAFFRREQLWDRRRELVAHRDRRIAGAITDDDLAVARGQIAELNRRLEKWNADVPSEFFIDPVSEIWLLTERAKEPGS